ncbi:acyltransferase [Chengkuizengella marina]|uniref:Acyltransferase n=1 Tax=Chengkuizengella marina TaxID=2507566 RepID=A0A6N9Q5H5_9BACL|nr:acyltransferase [Chengkuizengella marina]NBI30115.1 acyltransferase [Chengkuizengella marina]
MKSYNAINVMRFAAALLVVSNHTYPFIDLSPTLNYFVVDILSRLTVPFFFMTSGYFLAVKLGERDSVLQKRGYVRKFALKILKLYVLWSLVYLPIQAVIWYVTDGDWLFWKEFVQKFIFAGGYYTLWYIPALIFASIFSYMLFSYFRPKTVLFITFLLFATGTMMQSYYDILPNKELLSGYYSLFLTTRNGLFFGSFFVCLGMYLKMRDNNKRFSTNLIMFVLSFLLLCGEVFNMMESDFSKGNGMWFMTIPTVYFLFSMFKDLQLKNRPIYKRLRPVSFIIYASHGFFILSLSALFDLNSLLFFILVFILSNVFAFALIWSGKKNHYIRQFY